MPRKLALQGIFSSVLSRKNFHCWMLCKRKSSYFVSCALGNFMTKSHWGRRDPLCSVQLVTHTWEKRAFRVPFPSRLPVTGAGGPDIYHHTEWIPESTSNRQTRGDFNLPLHFTLQHCSHKDGLARTDNVDLPFRPEINCLCRLRNSDIVAW